MRLTGLMQANAIIEQQPHSDDRRDDARWRIRLEVSGSLGDDQANVVIHDISTAGMLIETNCDLAVGQSIAVALPQADAVAARIVWRNEPLFGCRFDQPLPQAAVSAVRLRSPIADAPASAQPTALAGTPEKAPEPLSERLRRLRRERGMTRTALSDRTGISKTTLWAWETGKSMPRHTNILVLSKIFGLTDQQLLMGEDRAPAHLHPDTGPESGARTLSTLVDQAKDAIARAAGTDRSNVHIRIDF
ncbi:helix-turn-helix domain-containing protein [Sphingobium mellinum]|uniref:helix-turn-helix domain-containing protein n=1 Tax=Sphingobium mellinum TaxID=1387166 RepID=UPI0030EB2014